MFSNRVQVGGEWQEETGRILTRLRTEKVQAYRKDADEKTEDQET